MAGRGVKVDFNADVARFTSGVDKAISDLSRFQSNSDRMAKNINNILGSIGVGLSAAGFVAFGKSVIDGLDKLGDLSKTTGLAVETLSGLGVAAKQSGTDLDGVAASISKLSVNIGKDGDKFKALGITAKDPLEAFKQLADVANAIQDPFKRDAVLSEALGKSWQAAAPLLSVGGAAIGRMVAEGTKATSVTKEMTEAADKFNDQMVFLNASAAGFGNVAAEQLLPALADISKSMADATRQGGLLKGMLAGFEALSGNMFSDRLLPRDQQIAGRLEEIGKAMDGIFARRKQWFASSSFAEPELQALNKEALALQKELETLQAAAAKPIKLPEPKAPSQSAINKFLGNSDAGKAVDSLLQKQQSFIESLQKESAMLGMTASEMKVYEAGLLKISGAKLDGVKASAERIEAFKAEKAALKDQMTFEASQAEEFYRLRDNAAKEAQQAIEAMNKEGQNLQLAVDPMARLNSEVERYSVLLEAGAISQKTFDLAVEKSADNMKKATEDGFDKMNAAMIGFQTNVQSTLGQGLYNAMTGKFDGIFAAWRDLLFRMVSAGLAAQVSESIFGANGKGGLLKAGLSILGSLGGLGKSPAPGALGSSTFGQSLWPVPKFAAGGDFSGGLRLVGENGPELEMTGPSRIFNAGQTKNILSGGRGASINYAPVINIDSRTDRSEVHAIVSRAVKQGNADLVDKLNRQGVI